MIQRLIFGGMIALIGLPTLVSAKQLLLDGNFNQTEHWSVTGVCQSQPDNCVYQASESDLEDLGSVTQYYRIGKKNSTDSIAQVVKLKKGKKKLHLKLKFKLSHSTQRHYNDDQFTIIVTGKEFGHSWRKDISYDPNKRGWQNLDYNLKEIVKINKGKNIVVSFFMDNGKKGATKAQITKIRLNQYN